MAKEWPFPGDAPVVRARKMTLAYRQVAQQEKARADALQRILNNVDLRLFQFANKDLASQIADLIANETSDAVADLDRRFREWGETWHADVVITYHNDDYLPTKEAAKLIQLAPGTLGRLRVRGRIKGEWRGKQRGFFYKVSDVYALSSELRGRGWRATDTVPTNGVSAPQ